MPETIALFEDYYLEAATDGKAFSEFFAANNPQVFSATATFSYQEALSTFEKESLNQLSKNFNLVFRLTYYLKKGDAKIGWFKGSQKDADCFSMSNTGIFRQYQGKGIYKAMLPKILAVLKEKGFQRVISYHQAGNNAVIVPKLKAGFVITGFEISDEYGLLIKLTYFFNETRRQAFDYRTGAVKMNDALASYFS